MPENTKPKTNLSASEILLNQLHNKKHGQALQDFAHKKLDYELDFLLDYEKFMGKLQNPLNKDVIQKNWSEMYAKYIANGSEFQVNAPASLFGQIQAVKILDFNHLEEFKINLKKLADNISQTQTMGTLNEFLSANKLKEIPLTQPRQSTGSIFDALLKKGKEARLSISEAFASKSVKEEKVHSKTTDLPGKEKPNLMTEEKVSGQVELPKPEKPVISSHRNGPSKTS